MTVRRTSLTSLLQGVQDRLVARRDGLKLATGEVSNPPGPREAALFSKLADGLDHLIRSPVVDRSLLVRTPPPVLPHEDAMALLFREVLPRENRFFQPGVGYDDATGMTFDGHSVDFFTGELLGGPKRTSAASKESLHVAYAVMAIRGDPVASVLMSPDPSRPEAARSRCIEILEKKIETYEAFDRAHPGFGGFLPWYRVKAGFIEPAPDWKDRVPALDNGQLAWSLYLAQGVLEEEAARSKSRVDETSAKRLVGLAGRYRAHFEKMSKNAVPMFYDRRAGKLHAEVKLARGSRARVERNDYGASRPGASYYLDDPYEGVLFRWFADLFGDWSMHPTDRDRLFSDPCREPAVYEADGVRIVTERGWCYSGHENWADLVLKPALGEVPVADAVIAQRERARTHYCADNDLPGPFAAMHRVRFGNGPLAYQNLVGIRNQPDLTLEPNPSDDQHAFYGTMPLIRLERERQHAEPDPSRPAVGLTWLNVMHGAPGALGPYGVVDGFSTSGRLRAPVLTWDGKLHMAALMGDGGWASLVREQLRREGKYGTFLERYRSDFAKLDGVELDGSDHPFFAPTVQFDPRL